MTGSFYQYFFIYYHAFKINWFGITDVLRCLGRKIDVKT